MSNIPKNAAGSEGGTNLYVRLQGRMRIATPSQRDVMCGRGKPVQNHAGNQRMREIVDGLRGRYQDVERSRKVAFVEDVFKTVKGYGGRFLKTLSGSGWVRVGQSVAFEKISHVFRSRYRRRPNVQHEELDYYSVPEQNEAHPASQQGSLSNLRLEALGISLPILQRATAEVLLERTYGHLLGESNQFVRPPTNLARPQTSDSSLCVSQLQESLRS